MGVKYLLLAALLIWPCLAQASAGFGAAAYGTDTTDRIDTGQTANLGTTFSLGAWFFYHGAGGVSLGRILDQNNGGGSGGFVLFDNEANAAGKMAFNVFWNSTVGSFNWTRPSSDAWHCIILTYDAGSVANIPIVYIDSSSVAVATGVTPAGAYGTTASAIYIGNRTDNTRGWNGMLAEVTTWSNKILTAQDAATFCQGFNPLRIQRSSNTFYAPLYAKTSTLIDLKSWGSNRAAMTVVGAKPQPQPAAVKGYPTVYNGMGQ